MTTVNGNSPQAFLSTYAPRLRNYANSLLIPVIQPQIIAAPLSRTTKRGTTAINYAEDGYDDYDDDDDDSRRRPTGLRSIRREDLPQARQDPSEKFGKEAIAPVQVQGVWREWMGKGRVTKNDVQNHAQTALPLTLVPIRIDLDIPAFNPVAALPPPSTYSHVDLSLPIYRQGEQTVPFRVKDTFLWNLHECLTTIDQFAQTMVQDLDLPRRGEFAQEIAKQIRNQLEDWASVALHPLFHTQQIQTSHGIVTTTKRGGVSTNATGTPTLSGNVTPLRNGTSHLNDVATPQSLKISTPALPEITASATAINPDSEDFNPDDMYRCIVNLSLNISNYLYTDQFEWSLLHPVGTAEMFAKQTCADLGLNGEWVATMTVAIYEAVLKLKREACDSGGLVGGAGIRNDAAHDAEAGWRYDPEHLADSWEPKIEILSKEEIDKREVERERSIRAKRRETQRFVAGGNQQPVENRGGYFDEPTGEERMGRGERSKKKRRWRSLSPPPGANTPGGARGTPDVGGYGGGAALADDQRNTWRCQHCKIWGTSVWAVRDGPAGPRTLCNNCGFLYERDHKLPRWFKDLHKGEMRAADFR